MKKSTVMRLIVSMLCVTMFTACGKRDSKKRNTGIYQGQKIQQEAVDTEKTAKEKEAEAQELAERERAEQKRRDKEAAERAEAEASEDTNKTGTSTNGTDITFEEDQNNNPSTNTNHDDKEISIEEGEATPVDTNTQTGSTNTNRAGNIPIEKVNTPSQGKTASNKATRRDNLSGLGFYADTPYSSQFTIPEATHTGLQTYTGDATMDTEAATEVNYTDIVSDNVMLKLKHLLNSDINNNSEQFEAQSLELSQNINSVYSGINIDNQTINVNIKVIQKGNTSQSNTLEFYGSLKEDGTARLTPTQSSADYNYVLDVVCLDKAVQNCQTQQLVLSYYYKKDGQDEHGNTHKKDSLCKRAYIVNRLGHATMNINSNPETGENYIEKYVTKAPYLSQVCDTDAYSNVENSIVCLADLTYNTIYKSLYNSCNSQGQNAACKSKFVNVPNGRYAQKIYLHTFAVAQGRAQYVVSLKDSDQRYMSFSGDLIDSPHATRANIGSLSVNKKQQNHSYLISHMTDLHLNGVDSQSVMQFRLKYAGINQIASGNALQSGITTDIIQRFQDINVGSIRSHFPAPVEGEMDDIKEDRDQNRDDDYSMKDKIKDKLKNIGAAIKKALKDDTLKINSIDHNCEELRTIVNENKIVHITGPKFFGLVPNSDNVYAEAVTCERRRDMGNTYQTWPSNWTAKDGKCQQLGYTCKILSGSSN